MGVVYIGANDKWPEAISDGLTLACRFCDKIPIVDYRINDDVWRLVVPREYQRDVVCLDCLIKCGKREMIAEAIEAVQITFPHMTVVCDNPQVFVYNYR